MISRLVNKSFCIPEEAEKERGRWTQIIAKKNLFNLIFSYTNLILLFIPHHQQPHMKQESRVG